MQLSLILEPPRAPLARRGDPETSHAAAESAIEFASAHRALILEALRQGPAGKDCIARRTGIHGVAVARRCSELSRDGLIETTGEVTPSDSGRLERVWRIAP